MTFVAAAGDGGAPGLYPAYSPNVVAVGGTTLQLNPDGSIAGQSAWSSSGGGASQYESRPSYQAGIGDPGARTIPDVAFLADRSVGVAVYDSYDDPGGSPWTTMGGTSLGAPAWAALIAIADQGRVAAGGTPLDGATQTLPALYSLPSADFHDITTGGNGSSNAGPGYDDVTGLGTPAADLLVPDLAFYGMGDHLVITAQPPASVTAGQPFGLTVEVQRPDGSLDSGASGNLTVSLGTNPGGAGLGGTLTASIDQGIASFSGLVIDQAGSGDALAISGPVLDSVASSTFEVTPAAPKVLVVASQPPATVTAGAGFGLTVGVEDAFGNVVTGYGSPVTVGLVGGPAGAGLGGNLSVSASGGAATFSGLTIDQAGSGYLLAASAPGLSAADATPVTVTPATPARIVVDSGPPTSVTAGAGFGLSVSVEDAFGNLATGFGGDVTVGLVGGPAGAVLGGTLTEPAGGGVATFSGLALDQAGSGYAIAATSGSLPAAQTGTFAVTPAAPAKLVISQPPPTSLVAGLPFHLGVSVEDTFGNVVTDADSPIALAVSGGHPGATLGGTTTATAVNGVATFDELTLDQVGSSYAIQASSPGLAGSSASGLDVAPSAPTQLVVTVEPPVSATAGAGFGLGVAVQDAFGNAVTGYGGGVSVSLSRGPAGARLSGRTTVTASGGVAAFSGLTLDEAAGSYVLQVSAVGVGKVSTGSFRVVAAAPNHLAIVGQPPSPLAAGQVFGLTVAAEDPYGNIATGFQGPVIATLASNPPGGPFSGPLATNAVDGIATLSGLSLDKAGAGYAIGVSAGGLAPATTTAIDVVPGAPRRLIIIAQPPGSVVARRPFAIGVEAVDDDGNLATSFDGTVTASTATGPRRNPLGGTLSVQANGGRAVIADATVEKPGRAYTITITGSGLTPAATSVFSVTRPGVGGFAGAVRRALRAHLGGWRSSRPHLPMADAPHHPKRGAVHRHRSARNHH